MDPAADKSESNAAQPDAVPPNGASSNGAAHRGTDSEEQHPARALTLHLLRMLETRMDAAGIALQSEVHSFSTRIQLKVLAGAAIFLAVWGGVVLLAIALPPAARIPVLSGVIVAFVLVAVWALMAAKKRVASRAVGSLHWFLEGLKLDLEVLSRSLHRVREAAKGPPEDRSAPRDFTH